MSKIDDLPELLDRLEKRTRPAFVWGRYVAALILATAAAVGFIGKVQDIEKDTTANTTKAVEHEKRIIDLEAEKRVNDQKWEQVKKGLDDLQRDVKELLRR